MAKTVKVRIAVLVDEDGDWNARGYYANDDPANAAEVGEYWGGPAATHIVWVEAEVPLPESTTIPGKVAGKEGA